MMPGQSYVLVVEDNLADARKVQRLLSANRWGIQVRIVERVSEGLEHIGEADPVVILTDLQLPDSRGLRTVDSLCAAAPHVPVVVLTATGFEDLGATAIKRGAEDFVPKGELSRETLSRVLALAVQRRQNQLAALKVAKRDALTGLPTRQDLESLIASARREGGCAVAFLDLDGFKSINDRYGHAVGDQVLRVVAARVTSELRPADSLVRLGGDEFVAVIADAESAGTDSELTRRLSRAIGRPMRVAGHELKVGVSIGVAYAHAHSQIESVIAQADGAMYAAKSGEPRLVTEEGAPSDHLPVRRHVIRDSVTGRSEGLTVSLRSASGEPRPVTLADLDRLPHELRAPASSPAEPGWLLLPVTARLIDDPEFETSLQRSFPRPAGVVLALDEASTRSVDSVQERVRRLSEAGFGIALDNFTGMTMRPFDLCGLPWQYLRVDVAWWQDSLNVLQRLVALHPEARVIAGARRPAAPLDLSQYSLIECDPH